MNLLIVAATKMEVEPFIHHFGLETGTITSLDHHIKLLVTGVGMVATAYSLGRDLALNQYDLAINAGIAGSFDPAIAIGDTVLVNEDHFSDFGAESDERFLSIDELGFGESKIIPLKTRINLPALKQVRGITVNTVHGNRQSIGAITERLRPQVESMEGAAFFYACNDARLPSLQLRAISNTVEERNTANWNIPVAVENLNKHLVGLLESIR